MIGDAAMRAVAERKRSRNPDKRVETFFMGFFSADAMSDCGLPPLNQRAIQGWGTQGSVNTRIEK
jgi:hypothetical protein